MKDKVSLTINEKILRDVDSFIDNIFIRNRSQAIEFLIKKAISETKTAIILVGDSKRLDFDRDKIRNRYGLIINHETIIEKAIRKLSDSGFKNIFIIGIHEHLTNIFKIIGDGANYNVKIEFIDEENTEGNASALKLLKGKIKTTFLVIQSDLVIDHFDLVELWQHHMQEKNVATIFICSSPTPGNKVKFGHVNLQGSKVISFDEKPSMKNLKSSIFFSGIMVAEPEIFSYPGKNLEWEIFPELVKRRLMGGLMSSSEHLHIHTRQDLDRVKLRLKQLTCD